MTDIDIRVTGRAGRITFTRPQALNALSHAMCSAIDVALRAWADDPAVALVVIDAEGDKAFCAGGDIAELYQTGMAGDFAYGRRFWADEYRTNARIADYPKPVVSFLQGFTMGGGVGIGCHGSHRVVGESSKIAMPEVGIGLVPDVGGSAILARAPGRLGAYLGLTAARMQAACAIHAGFADHFVPQSEWPALIALLESSGDAQHVNDRARPLEPGPLQQAAARIDALFAADDLTTLRSTLSADDSTLAQEAARALDRNSPLSMACALDMLRRLRNGPNDIRTALDLEYRFTFRAMEQGDFLEGIRAQIIDKDRSPRWRHADSPVTQAEISAMLAPLGADSLNFEEEPA